MAPSDYHDFFVVEGGAAAALLGLLFVAISVRSENVVGANARIVDQARASSALTAFLIPLGLSLVGLLPNSNIGYIAVILSVPGLLYLVATIRRFFSVPKGERESVRGLIGMTGFAIVLALFLAWGIVILVDPHDAVAVAALSSISVASLFIGVDRAWALVGGRDRGRISSIHDIVVGEPREEENDH